MIESEIENRSLLLVTGPPRGSSLLDSIRLGRQRGDGAFSGCGAIFSLPFAKADLLAGPIIGLFDPLARPYVEKNLLTFPVPAGLFVRMVENVLESFLGNRTWGTIRRRIQG